MCFFWVACPLPGKLARVGGHRCQPVLNPAMHKASDAGHIGPHGMRRCLSFSYRGTRRCRRPPPEAKKRLFFEGVGLGQGAGAQKSRTPGGNLFFSDFLKIFDVAFLLCKNLGACIKHRKYRQKMKLRTFLQCF